MFNVTATHRGWKRPLMPMLALVAATTWLASPVTAQQNSAQSEQADYWGIVVTLKHPPQRAAAASRPMRDLVELIPELDDALRNVDPAIPLGKIYHVSVVEKPLPAIEGLLKSLRANPLVASATINPDIMIKEASGRVQRPFAPPQARGFTHPVPDFDTTTSYVQTQQRYLGAFDAPAAGDKIGGLDVNAVRDVKGGDGKDVRIILFSEHQWNANHPNLPQPVVQIDYPWIVCPPSYDNPSSPNFNISPMVGILAARDKGFGIVGIVPDAEVGLVEFPVGVVNGPNLGPKFDMHFQKLLDLVKPGDVVVMDTKPVFEYDVNFRSRIPPGACPSLHMGSPDCTIPREAFDRRDMPENIEKLTTKGAHVILDAGWGGMDLDSRAWRGFFDRRVRDSGAIYVGAVDPRTGARPVGTGATDNSDRNNKYANYGSIIDLAGWSTKPEITTTYYGNRGYTTTFGAYMAVPQIAGIVALVQSVANANGIGPIPPREMRELLVKTGHALPHNDPSKPIGKYPDANAAVQELLKEHADGVLEGALNAPGIVKAGQAVTMTADVTDPKKGTLTYAWTKPEGFTGDISNSPSVTLTPPHVDKETVKVAQVTVTSSSGQSITLSKPLLIETAPLSGSLTGPETIASGATAKFTADVAHAPTATVTYHWSLPAGFTSNARNTREITVTVPSVTAATPANLAVIASQGAANSVALYKDVTVQPASAPNPSEPGNGSSCHETWKASQAYATAGQLVTYNGRNYKNKWWTQGEDPASVGQWGVWEDVGACAQ
jgi:hypothetical protein